MHPDGLSLDIHDLCDVEGATDAFAAEIELLYRLIECVVPGVTRDGPMLVKHLIEPLSDVAAILRLRGALSASDHAASAWEKLRQGFISNRDEVRFVVVHLHEAIRHAAMTQTALVANAE